MTQEATHPVDYSMKISRLTIDKLGVKLYDRVSAVIAELIANSYDADATTVDVSAPMGQYLATKRDKQVVDRGFVIEVNDDGIGMTPEEVQEFYLRVGAERRKDPRRGDLSKNFKRKVMGRKGVGKLAPFGICRYIELISSGGEPVVGVDEYGNEAIGYLTAHILLDRDAMLTDEDENYKPKIEALDGIVRPYAGTKIRLTGFAQRQVPDLDDFDRQIAQRFGISSEDWSILLQDTSPELEEAPPLRVVGEFRIATMPHSLLRFEVPQYIQPVPSKELDESYSVRDGNNDRREDLLPGFWHEEMFYPVSGWVAYAAVPYRDELMAGIRIYCRGKIAAQTNIFERSAGFTGEYNIRSYLVGEIRADWLDEEEDLIQTDRRDILWSNDLGEAFQNWGRDIVVEMGKLTRDPLKTQVWEQFRSTSKIDQRIGEAFPLPEQAPIRQSALEIAHIIGQSMRNDEMYDDEQVETISRFSLLFAPHLTLDETLRRAGDASTTLAVITQMLRTARIAELSSFGKIAEDRVKVISKVEDLKDDAETVEAALQTLIQQAPWLIDPQWSPITSNQAFSTLRSEFVKYFKEETGEDITLASFESSTKRADFVLSSQDGVIQIIEIKRPSHSFDQKEMDRLQLYMDVMTRFLAQRENEEFSRLFRGFHVTLVCDSESLSGVYKQAFDKAIADKILTYINWRSFLMRTRKMHEAFLNEAERQKRDAARGQEIEQPN